MWPVVECGCFSLVLVCGRCWIAPAEAERLERLVKMHSFQTALVQASQDVEIGGMSKLVNSVGICITHWSGSHAMGSVSRCTRSSQGHQRA